MIKQLLPQLIKYGKVQRSWLGVQVDKAEKKHAKDPKKFKGALITQVISQSPAEKGGLLVGDRIIKFNYKEVEDGSHLSWLASTAGIGSTIPVVLIRKGRQKAKSVQLVPMPQ